MSTATMQAIAKDNEAKDERVFQQMMEHFSRQWAPDDRDDAAAFHADLGTLIRRVYIDAQAPLAAQINTMLLSWPVLLSNPPRKDGT